MALDIKCPRCEEVGGVHKYGTKMSGYNRLQMYQCRCGKVFSERQLAQAIVEVQGKATKTAEPVKDKPKAKSKPEAIKAVCPFCGGRLMKAGMDLRDPKNPMQRYKCSQCNRRTKLPKGG